MLVFEERGKPEYPEKNHSEQSRETNDKLNPHMTPGPGIEPETHGSEAGAAPSLLPFCVCVFVFRVSHQNESR